MCLTPACHRGHISWPVEPRHCRSWFCWHLLPSLLPRIVESHSPTAAESTARQPTTMLKLLKARHLHLLRLLLPLPQQRPSSLPVPARPRRALPLQRPQRPRRRPVSSMFSSRNLWPSPSRSQACSSPCPSLSGGSPRCILPTLIPRWPIIGDPPLAR